VLCKKICLNIIIYIYIYIYIYKTTNFLLFVYWKRLLLPNFWKYLFYLFIAFIILTIYLSMVWYFGEENRKEGRNLSEKKGNLTSGRSANGTNDAIINCTKDWPLRPFHTRNLKEASSTACATRNLLTRSNYTRRNIDILQR